MADIDAKIVGLVLVRRPPDLTQQMLVGDDASRVLRQESKDGELLAGEF